jgi:hypothetical protein
LWYRKRVCMWLIEMRSVGGADMMVMHMHTHLQGTLCMDGVLGVEKMKIMCLVG